MAKSQIVQVEACAPLGRQVIFKPIGKSVRGRLDFSKPQNKTQQLLARAYPTPVPGQRFCIDYATGKKWILEPLHLPEYEELRSAIIHRGFKLPQREEVYDSESLATWTYHLQRLVDSGLARVVEGELPDVKDFEDKPRKRFIGQDTKSDNAKMADALNALVAATQANTAMLAALADKIAGRSGASKA